MPLGNKPRHRLQLGMIGNDLCVASISNLSPSSLQDSPSHLVLECQILECHLVLEFGTGGFCRYVSLNMSCSVCWKLNWQFSEHLDKCGTFSRLHYSQSVNEHFAHTHILPGLYGAPAWKRFARGRTPTRNLPITGQKLVWQKPAHKIEKLFHPNINKGQCIALLEILPGPSWLISINLDSHPGIFRS